MHYLRSLLILTPLLFCFNLCSLEIDYSGAQSREDVLLLETNAIVNSTVLADKTEAYISRAESYLLMGKNKEALEDYEEGYLLAQILSEEDKLGFSFRALFGSTIAYFN